MIPFCIVYEQIRKRDWNEQGSLLKARINAKLLVYQAAAKLKLKSLGSLDSEGKVAKKLVFETFALLMDAAEACILSIWRKLRVCEELFSCLLAVLGKIAVAWKGQPLRVLLIRLKPLVLTVCAQVYSLKVVLDLEVRSAGKYAIDSFIHLVFTPGVTLPD